MSPTERLKSRRQTVAAAGKKSTTSLSLFMETYGLFSTRQKEYGQEKVESRAKRSLDEADSGGPNVEKGERACRSSDE